VFEDKRNELQQGISGRILVATPQLDSSVFEKTLIFICMNSHEGSIGVIFNKMSANLTAKDLLQKQGMEDYFKGDKKLPIFKGGPVDDGNIIVLSASKKQKSSIYQYAQLTIYNNIEVFLRDVTQKDKNDKFIICQGLCSWAPNQLEREISENAWLIIESAFKIIFSKKPEQEWGRIVKKMGIKNFTKLVPYTGNA
jgi:putative transcriptional regulator